MKKFIKNNKLFCISFLVLVISFTFFLATQRIINLLYMNGILGYILALSCALVSFKMPHFGDSTSKAKSILRLILRSIILLPSCIFLFRIGGLLLAYFLFSIPTVYFIYAVKSIDSGKSVSSYFSDKESRADIGPLIILVTIIMVLVINIIAIPFGGCDSSNKGSSTCWVCGGNGKTGKYNDKKCWKCEGWGVLKDGIAPRARID